MTRVCRCVVAAVLIVVGVSTARGQVRAAPDSLEQNLRQFVEIPAVSGYEQQLARAIAEKLKGLSPKIDAQGNIQVSVGKGAPHRLIVTAIDEPGFVVSGITPEGYMTVQRLPQGGNLPLFNELYSAQPVKIGTTDGKWIDGAVAGISLHLLPQRQHPPSAADLDNMFIDSGATNAAEAKSAGADVLSPVGIDRSMYSMGFGEATAPAIGDRVGAAALVDVLLSLDVSRVKGSVTFAFVVQQWLGARGLQRVIFELKPDEVIYVGRCMRAAVEPGQHEPQAFKAKPGDGVVIASDKPEEDAGGLADELQKLATNNKLKITTDYSAPLLPRGGYMRQPKLPDRTVHLAVATEWPSTPAEVLQMGDISELATLLQLYLGQQPHETKSENAKALGEPAAPTKPASAPPVEEILRRLIETYAASEHEGNMRTAVSGLLPPWAKPETDNALNLVLHVASSSGGSKKPSIAVVAHMDEIGYEVRSVLPDGRLELKEEGSGIPAYFLGHAALVHSGNGMHPGVLELPDGWDKPDFQWPRGRNQVVRMDVGANNPDQVTQLGIKPGDFVTIPKKYRNLLGHRASARALDDRVGCAALVAATWALGGNSRALADRDITFIWSTREELGLLGAAGAAENMAANGHRPDYVFAIDTFVSSDSPLESKRFGNGILGNGFVVRAVDNSNVVPRDLAERVVSLARSNNIAAQYGVTGGGNDGAAFLLYGSTDVALGWPLRYSHSPAEVIDTRDVDALSRIIAVIVRNW